MKMGCRSYNIVDQPIPHSKQMQSNHTMTAQNLKAEFDRCISDQELSNKCCRAFDNMVYIGDIEIRLAHSVHQEINIKIPFGYGEYHG